MQKQVSGEKGLALYILYYMQLQGTRYKFSMISPGCIGSLQYTNFQVIRPSRSEYAGCGRDCVTLRCYDLKCRCPWHSPLYNRIWAVWTFFFPYGVSETSSHVIGGR